jgi:hypothetical protein
MDELTPDEQRYFKSKGAVAPDPADSPDTAAAESVPADAPIEPKPGDDGEGQAATPAAPRESHRVPLGELLSERERRRGAESELARDRARLATLEAHLAMLAEGDGALPDKAADPEGYTKALAGWAERHKTLLSRLRAEAGLQAQQSEAAARVMAIYRAQADDFEKQHPDFNAAYRHLLDDRNAELMTLGYGDPLTRGRIITEEESAIVARALADGANPAERIYAVARRRGYRPGSGDGERLRLAEKGQAAGKSLGSAPGGATRAVSPEALATLTDAEFAKATAGANWKRLWQ